jgi:hypothetical protein
VYRAGARSSLGRYRVVGGAFAGLWRQTSTTEPLATAPRPLPFGRVDAGIERILADPPPGTLARTLSRMDNAIEETRVARGPRV